jgi:hypothetical protein
MAMLVITRGYILASRNKIHLEAETNKSVGFNMIQRYRYPNGFET